MNTIELEIYITENGKSSYVKWMDSLSECFNNKVTRRLANVKLGNFGDVKPIKGVRGFYEMRIYEGPGYRIYYGKVGSTVVILLCAGIKGTQKRDIDRAKRYWQDYLSN